MTFKKSELFLSLGSLRVSLWHKDVNSPIVYLGGGAGMSNRGWESEKKKASSQPQQGVIRQVLSGGCWHVVLLGSLAALELSLLRSEGTQGESCELSGTSGLSFTYGQSRLPWPQHPPHAKGCRHWQPKVRPACRENRECCTDGGAGSLQHGVYRLKTIGVGARDANILVS